MLFLICTNLLNCLRSLGTMVIATESGQNSLKVILTKQYFTKVAIFCCFGVRSVRPPQIFQVQAKISTVRPIFPDYLSISYDFGFKLFLTIFFRLFLLLALENQLKICHFDHLIIMIKLLKRTLVLRRE